MPHVLTCPSGIYRTRAMFKFGMLKSRFQTGDYTCERKRTWILKLQRRSARHWSKVKWRLKTFWRHSATSSRAGSLKLGTDVEVLHVCFTKHCCFFGKSSCCDAEGKDFFFFFCLDGDWGNVSSFNFLWIKLAIRTLSLSLSLPPSLPPSPSRYAQRNCTNCEFH